MVNQFFSVTMIAMMTLAKGQQGTQVSAQDIFKEDINSLKKVAFGTSEQAGLAPGIIDKLQYAKSYLYDGLNSYQSFREGLMTVMKLESFMDFFDRTGNCCSAATGVKKSLSGYYEGQWRLLDSSPGLQAFLSEE